MSNQQCREEYMRRIHTVQDYIGQHLGEAMSIEVLANIAGFSKYHFSRIFQGVLHEPLAHYVSRIRMENARFLLAHRRDKSITEIAYELGFNGSAVFARAFKGYYGISASSFRKEYSKDCKDSFLISNYNKGAVKSEWKDEEPQIAYSVSIETLPQQQMVYVRHTGTYETLGKEYQKLMGKLLDYAKKQQLFKEETSWVLAMYHDNPEFGQEDKFRTSLCLTVPDELEIREDGILGKMKLQGGLYAVGHFRIQQQQYAVAWDCMYQKWLTGSGYVPRNADPFEVYLNNPYTDEGHMHEVDIYVPIEPIHFK